MRRGCIAVGIIKCDICGKIIEHGDRYLILEEETEPRQRVCLDCCEKQHYGRYEIEKGERIFTLLMDEIGQAPEKKKSEKKAAEKAPVAVKVKTAAKPRKEPAEKPAATKVAAKGKAKAKKKGAKGK